MSNLSLPGARSSIIDKDGRVDTVWFNFFEALLRRAGGAGEVTDLSGVISLLTDAINNINDLRDPPGTLEGAEALRQTEELRHQLATTRGTVDELRSQIEELRTELAQGRADDLRSRIDTIETRLG